ncbi:MAG: lysophospholipid acyltransferase family protein [Egibacteraceae bacterium]
MPDTEPDPQRWRGSEPWFAPVALVLRALAWLLADVRVVRPDRLPRSGPVVVAANHVSRLDPPVVGVVVYRLRGRVRFLVVEELFRTPVLGWALRTTRMIPVRRGGGTERMVAEAVAALQADQAMIVYPEGTIPAPGEVLAGRPGAGLLALRAHRMGVPVVPMASWGLDHRGHGRMRLLRRRATVTFGPPVDLSAWAERDDREAQLQAGAAVLAAVRSLLPGPECGGRDR